MLSFTPYHTAMKPATHPLSIDVQLLPISAEAHRLADATAIVVDVLRASTTIVHALAHGARAVIPALEVDDALRLAKKFNRDAVVLGGERHGELIPGFDLDNSPLHYTPETVRDKTVIFTTTNGTRALLQSANAEWILIGAMVNLHAAAQAAFDAQKSIQIVCAGTEGEISAEDVLTAGAIVAELQQLCSGRVPLNDSAVLARDFYFHHSQTQEALIQAFCESKGGRNLLDLGFTDDIERSATPNVFAVVPVFDQSTGEITASTA
ncbi:MAG: 2-phosphosulfolactate phosphatase [Planctomycetaceae bacterium]